MNKVEQPQNSLTGQWHGFYVQSQKQHRIVMQLTQDGSRLFGEMVDVDNVTDEPLYEALANSGCEPGTDEEIADQLKKLIPEAGDEPITSHSVLPEHSTIEGKVTGLFVKFQKQYQGQTLHAFKIGDKSVGEVIDGHTVEYSGQLSNKGTIISGRWTVYGAGGSRGFLDGGFELRKS